MQILLGYCIKQIQPSYHISWGPTSLWLFSPNLSITRRVKVCCHIAQSWKVMARMMTFLSLSCLEDTLQLRLWWQIEYKEFYSSITMDRGFILYSKGLDASKIFGIQEGVIL